MYNSFHLSRYTNIRLINTSEPVGKASLYRGNQDARQTPCTKYTFSNVKMY